MHASIESQTYLPGEVAAAAGVDVADVLTALGGVPRYVGHAEAVAVSLALRRRARSAGRAAEPHLLSGASTRPAAPVHLPLVVSGSLHAIVLALAVFATQAAPVSPVAPAGPSSEARLVFLNIPGPGGGGGGGGQRRPTPASRAMRAGQSSIPSAVPERRRAAAVEPPSTVVPPPSTPPLAEVVAPVVPVPADPREQAGTPDGPDTVESAGPGAPTGAGSGTGTGFGAGDGSGLGDGQGGGTGGGPFRPGSGITPPRLLREVKPAYTEAALRAGVTGEVLLEVVVTSAGTVGQVRLVRGLGSGLDQRATDAIRQWRFTPALRHGQPVDVLVEVSVAFSVR